MRGIYRPLISVKKDSTIDVGVPGRDVFGTFPEIKPGLWSRESALRFSGAGMDAAYHEQ